MFLNLINKCPFPGDSYLYSGHHLSTRQVVGRHARLTAAAHRLYLSLILVMAGLTTGGTRHFVTASIQNTIEQCN